MRFACVLQNVLFWAAFLERQRGIAGVPFIRTELSLRLPGTEFCVLLPRHGLRGPRAKGMRKKFDVHDCLELCLQVSHENP